MEIRYEYQTGRYNEQRQVLKNRVRGFARNSDEFYIGKTSAPETRAWSHELNSPGRWDEMIVLYRTGSPRFVKKMETDLIEHFWGRENLANKRAGGGGVDGSPPYYVYILRRS